MGCARRPEARTSRTEKPHAHQGQARLRKGRTRRWQAHSGRSSLAARREEDGHRRLDQGRRTIGRPAQLVSSRRTQVAHVPQQISQGAFRQQGCGGGTAQGRKRNGDAALWRQGRGAQSGGRPRRISQGREVGEENQGGAENEESQKEGMNPKLHTPVCDLLGCELPIVLAGMGGPSRSELVAAVTRAGGFGFLGMVRESPDLIYSEIEKVRAKTDRDFGVNLIPAATK